MVTYPSTHGVYEDTITELCEVVHDARRPGLRRRREPQRAAGLRDPAPSAATSRHLNLHKTFCIPHGGGGPGVGPVGVRAHLAPYLPSHPMHPEPGEARGHRPDQRRAVRLRGHPADLLGVRPADGRRGADPGDRERGAGGQLRRGPAARPLPGALPGPRRAGRARVHPRPARPDQGDRRQRRRRREAAHRLRLPRADHVVPGRRHPDGGAHRVRGPRRDRPLLRRDDRDQGGDRPRRRGGVERRGLTRCATPRTPRGPWSRSGSAPTSATSAPSRPGPTRTSTGRRWAGSTRRTATGNLVCSCPPPEAFDE